ncbi:hypothetical protein RyT2_13080 [Pseudolactococcus yaeyamensis]
MYKILLVDDEYPSYQLIFSTYPIFQTNDFVISNYAENGVAALDILKTEQFDLIISDIRMPIMNGIEFLRQLRADNDNVPVILASTFTEFSYAVEGLRLNALDYIEKPFTETKMTYLLTKISPLLAQKQARRQTFDFENLSNLSDKALAFLKKCQSIIQEELANPFLMDELSEQLHLSKKYISRYFKALTNQNLLDYITLKRLTLATDLLTTTHLKIYEVSEQVGYQTVDYFSKKFKEKYQLTPNQYRKK